ncbi:RusA family crossover junction endodeoxyribonuclease [Acinetobacter phage Ab69]|nr:RusA family crossover junction endodeoxyribonuclease [Acinetobacter phage Ab69]
MVCLDMNSRQLYIKRGPVIKGGLIKIKVFELDVAINEQGSQRTKETFHIRI